MSETVTQQKSIDTEPTITVHIEPESQATVRGEPTTYFRCECGREAMRRKDLRSGAHREECSRQ